MRQTQRIGVMLVVFALVVVGSVMAGKTTTKPSHAQDAVTTSADAQPAGDRLAERPAGEKGDDVTTSSDAGGKITEGNTSQVKPLASGVRFAGGSGEGPVRDQRSTAGRTDVPEFKGVSGGGSSVRYQGPTHRRRSGSGYRRRSRRSYNSSSSGGGVTLEQMNELLKASEARTAQRIDETFGKLAEDVEEIKAKQATNEVASQKRDAAIAKIADTTNKNVVAVNKNVVAVNDIVDKVADDVHHIKIDTSYASAKAGMFSNLLVGIVLIAVVLAVIFIGIPMLQERRRS